MSFALSDFERAETIPPEITDALAVTRVERGVFGEPLYFYTRVGSTNDIAARLADLGVSEGTAVVAEEQTAGRGRSGRAWFSAPGAGLYLSVVIRPGAAISPGLLTLAAGVALARGLTDATGLRPDIKWPNDLLCDGRKLAGILAEASASGAKLDAVILGIGINLHPVAYPPDIAARATSLEAELGRPSDRGLVLARSLVRLSEIYAALRRGETAAVLDAWRALAPSATGRRVAWADPAGERQGVTAGIDGEGALLVDTDGGRVRVIAGEVIWR